MNAEQLVNDIEKLPPEAQLEIANFVAIVKKYYQVRMPMPQITKGDKTIDPSVLFGIWENQPIEPIELRKMAWHRDFL
jgi:hypothetical protein